MSSLSKKEMAMVLRLRDEFTYTINRAGDSTKEFETKAKTSLSSVGDYAKMAGTAFKLYLGYQALSFLKDIPGYIYDVTVEVENIRARLVGMTGSVEGASAMFEHFREVAATVPYALGEVSNAGVTLEAFGADARDTLKDVSDLAAFMGIDLVEASQAFGRAWAGGAGSARVLRQRGVLNVIKKMRPEIEDLTKLTLPEFRKVLLESMRDIEGPIANSSSRLAGTLGGQVSMLEDAVYSMAVAVGEAGASDVMKGAVQSFTWLALAGKDIAEGFATASKQVGSFVGVYELASNRLKMLFGGEQYNFGNDIQARFDQAILMAEQANKKLGEAKTNLAKVENEIKSSYRYMSGLGMSSDLEKKLEAAQRAVNGARAMRKTAEQEMDRVEKLQKTEKEKRQALLGNKSDGPTPDKPETNKEYDRLLEKLEDYGKSKQALLTKQYDADLVLLGDNVEAKANLHKRYKEQIAQLDAADEEKAEREKIKAEKIAQAEQDKYNALFEKEAQRLADEQQKYDEDLATIEERFMGAEELEFHLLDEKFAREIEKWAGHDKILLNLNEEYLRANAALQDKYDKEEERKRMRKRRQDLRLASAQSDALLSLSAAFLGSQFSENKKYAKAEALISTGQGIANALTVKPTALGIALAAKVAAEGYSQVANIGAVEPGSSSSGGTSVGGADGSSGDYGDTTDTTSATDTSYQENRTLFLNFAPGMLIGPENYMREQFIPELKAALADGEDAGLDVYVNGRAA